jgi:hypothetical protein
MGLSKMVGSLQKQYRQLQQEIGQIGFIAVGTITPRRIIKPDPDDRRRKKIYGPYYQWTYKLGGKTITINLTKDRAVELQKAIDNQRKIESIIKNMQELSRRILEATTAAVPMRMRAPRAGEP